MADPIHIVTVGYNNWHESRELIDSIKLFTTNYHLIFVNNGSNDDTAIESQKYICDNFHIVQLDKNYGFSGGFNAGLNMSHQISNDPEQYICIINNDIVVRPNWLETLKEAYENCEKGILVNTPLNGNKLGYVAPLNSFTANKAQECKEGEKPGWYSDKVHYAQSEVPFMCLFFKRKMIDDIGYLDAEVSPVGLHEDSEYNWRLRINNYVNYIDGSTWIQHKGSRTVYKIPNIAHEHWMAGERLSAKQKLWNEQGRTK